MNLLDFYRQILQVGGFVTNEDGLISRRLAKTEALPATVDGRRMCLPTPEFIRNPDNDSRVMFHPLQEIVSRGESKVMQTYREGINRRLDFVIGYSSLALLNLIVCKDLHPKLSPDQTDLLVKVRNVDEGTLARFAKITENMLIGDDDRKFAHIYVKKNAKIDGEHFQRAGIVSFPFYEQICKVPAKGEKNEVYGVAIRHADRAAFKAIMEFLFPSIEKPSAYWRGAVQHVAPSLEALLRTTAAVYDNINSVIDSYKKVADFEDLELPGEWEEVAANLVGLLPQIRMIPPQPGNEGSERSQGSAGAVVDASILRPKAAEAAAVTDLSKILPKPVAPVAPVAPAQTLAAPSAPRRTLGMPVGGEASASGAPTLSNPVRVPVQSQTTQYPQQVAVVQQPTLIPGTHSQPVAPNQVVITAGGLDLGAMLQAQMSAGAQTGFGFQQPQRQGGGRSQYFSNQGNIFGGGVFSAI